MRCEERGHLGYGHQCRNLGEQTTDVECVVHRDLRMAKKRIEDLTASVEYWKRRAKNQLNRFREMSDAYHELLAETNISKLPATE